MTALSPAFPTPTTQGLEDPETIAFYRKQWWILPTAHLIEESHVIAAIEAMDGLDDHEYPPDVVERSAIDLASQRAAIKEILGYRRRHNIEVPPPSYGIPRPVIDEIKARRPIRTEIELMTDLRQSGETCRGVCPICPGKSNPSSLAVWSDRDSWHCFICNVGGDLVAWAMATTGHDFPEAVGYLAKTTGVSLPSTSAATNGRRSPAQIRAFAPMRGER